MIFHLHKKESVNIHGTEHNIQPNINKVGSNSDDSTPLCDRLSHSQVYSHRTAAGYKRFNQSDYFIRA